MRLIPGFAAALVTVAGLAAPALAGAYSPFLKELRTKVEHQQAISGSDVRARNQLGRAIAALYRPSDSMVTDLRNFSRAVAILEVHPDMEYQVQTGVWEEVHTAIYLFWDRLQERGNELREMDTDSQEMTDRELHRFVRGRDMATRIHFGMNMDAARHGNWRDAARQLLWAAKLLDRAAVLMGVDRGYTFVRGSVTATINGVEYEWTIATATVGRDFGFPIDYNRKELRIRAHSAVRHSSFTMDSLKFTAPGVDVYGGGLLLEAYPNELWLFPLVTYMLYPASDESGVSFVTLDALDVDAGTASGTFTLHMLGPVFGGAVEVIGRYDITGGLLRRR